MRSNFDALDNSKRNNNYDASFHCFAQNKAHSSKKLQKFFPQHQNKFKNNEWWEPLSPFLPLNIDLNASSTADQTGKILSSHQNSSLNSFDDGFIRTNDVLNYRNNGTFSRKTCVFYPDKFDNNIPNNPLHLKKQNQGGGCFKQQNEIQYGIWQNGKNNFEQQRQSNDEILSDLGHFNLRGDNPKIYEQPKQPDLLISDTYFSESAIGNASRFPEQVLPAKVNRSQRQQSEVPSFLLRGKHVPSFSAPNSQRSPTVEQATPVNDSLSADAQSPEEILAEILRECTEIERRQSASTATSMPTTPPDSMRVPSTGENFEFILNPSPAAKRFKAADKLETQKPTATVAFSNVGKSKNKVQQE